MNDSENRKTETATSDAIRERVDRDQRYRGSAQEARELKDQGLITKAIPEDGQVWVARAAGAFPPPAYRVVVVLRVVPPRPGEPESRALVWYRKRRRGPGTPPSPSPSPSLSLALTTFRRLYVPAQTPNPTPEPVTLSGVDEQAPYPTPEQLEILGVPAYTSESMMPDTIATTHELPPDAKPIEQRQGAEPKDTNPKDALAITRAPLMLIPGPALAEEALAMYDGAVKYGPFNWRDKGVKASVYMGAMLRHLFRWYNGLDRDPVSRAHELGHVRAGAGILLDAIHAGKFIDDRPPAADMSLLLDSIEARAAMRLKKGHKA